MQDLRGGAALLGEGWEGPPVSGASQRDAGRATPRPLLRLGPASAPALRVSLFFQNPKERPERGEEPPGLGAASKEKWVESAFRSGRAPLFHPTSGPARPAPRKVRSCPW